MILPTIRASFDRQVQAREETTAGLEDAIGWLETHGRFDDSAQRTEVVSLYRDAQERLRAGDLPD